MNERQTNWHEFLASAYFSLNTSHTEAIQFSPFYLVFGRLPVLPAKLHLTEPHQLSPQKRDTLRDLVQG